MVHICIKEIEKSGPNGLPKWTAYYIEAKKAQIPQNQKFSIHTK